MQRHSASEAAAAEALRALHVQLDQQASAVVNIRDSAQRVIQDMVSAPYGAFSHRMCNGLCGSEGVGGGGSAAVSGTMRRMGLIGELVVDSAVGYRVSNTAPRWIEPLRRSPLCGGGLQTASRFDSPSTFLHFLGTVVRM